MEKIYKNGYDFFFWPYEPQTKIKHFVFTEYFDKWVTIVGKWNDLNYFDCFAGSGAYIENDKIHYGSPILAAEVIEKNKENLDRKVTIVLIEKDKNNIENICKLFKHRGLNTEPIIIEGSFDAEINKLLDETKGNLKPTFFFIDPFGFKIKFQTLQRIMAIPKSEILLNFMFTQVNRFLIDELEDTLNDLFGCKDWKALKTLSGTEREQGIVNLYRTKLKEFSKFAFPYRLSFSDRDRTYYYLFHLTNNLKGCSIMKSAFAKFNYGKVEFSGPKHGCLTLFDNKDMKVSEIKQFLVEKYKGQTKRYEDILIEIIDSELFLEAGIKTALKEMEGKEAKIARNPELTEKGRKRKSIDLNDAVTF
ncbi:MAG: three-Cys-motif partner protein TcmP [Thermodesulfovibrionia bacterium]|nr:three-Cys-motif partner protein TcmP [Thermodesulfovibrionia bacterium]